MSKTNRHKILIPFLFISLILFSVYNEVANGHTHILDNGQVEVHAHPFTNGDSSNNSEHEHSDVNFHLIKSITHSTYIIAFILLAIALINKIFRKKIAVYISPILENSTTTIFKLRGPPLYL